MRWRTLFSVAGMQCSNPLQGRKVLEQSTPITSNGLFAVVLNLHSDHTKLVDAHIELDRAHSARVEAETSFRACLAT